MGSKENGARHEIPFSATKNNRIIVSGPIFFFFFIFFDPIFFPELDELLNEITCPIVFADEMTFRIIGEQRG
jgi:hypothetical protein